MRNYLANMIAEYSVETITKTAKTTYEYIQSVSAESDGSGYDLGKIDYTNPVSLLGTIPAALNVTLFRPYIWESPKVLMLISSLESLAFLLITLYVFLRVGVIRFFKILLANKVMLFFVFFALPFAIAVGFSTGNFGTLVRYKIPCMPFYLMCILFIYKYHTLSKVVKKNAS